MTIKERRAAEELKQAIERFEEGIITFDTLVSFATAWANEMDMRIGR